jgi:hypothetical protein
LNIPDDLRFSMVLENKFQEKHGKTYSVVTTDPIEEIRNSVAETTSLWSALSETKFKVPEKLTAKGYMAWWLGLNILVPDCDFIKDRALKEILQIAIQRYQPENEYELWIEFIWKFFPSEKFSEKHEPGISPYNPAEIIEFLLEKLSRDDVFGNMTMQVAKYLERSQQVYRLRKLRPSKVKRPQRKRGYNDKGSRRAPHISTIGKEYTAEQMSLYFLKVYMRETVETWELIEYGNWTLYPYRQ